MATRSIRDDIKLELKLRILPILRKDADLYIPVNVNLYHLETVQLGWKDEWRRFPVQELFTIVKADRREPKAWVVAGNVGAGKTSLARSVLHNWLVHDGNFGKIHSYEGVFIIDGENLEKDETLSRIQTVLPDTISHWGIDQFFDWVEQARILLIVDDFLLDTDQETKLMDLLNEWRGTEVLLMTNMEDGIRVMKLVDPVRPVLYCRFSELIYQLQDAVAEYVCKKISGAQNKDFQGVDYMSRNKILKPLFNTFGGIIDYCRFIHEFNYTKYPESLTSFLWDLFYENVKFISCNNYFADERLDEWIMALGKRCFECLAGGAPLLGEEVTPLLETTSYLFPENSNPSFLVQVLFASRLSLDSEDVVFCVRHSMQQEMLAAFYLLRKNMEGISLKRMLKVIKKNDVYDNLSVYVAGLLAKMVSEEGKFFLKHPIEEDSKRKFKKIERVLRNFSIQRELSPDPMTFTLRIINELGCQEDLVNIFLEDIVLPSQYHIHDVGIYAKPLNRILQHTYPSKIHFLMRRGYKSPGLKKALKSIKNDEVKIALMDMNMLEWGKECRSDKFIQILFEGQVKLQDFIGCLEENTIIKLSQYEAMKHLVCLRVRVCDSQAAKSLVATKDHLPHLMWLEIDFDFPLSHIFALGIPPISTPLIDFSFSSVTDADITHLCDFLHSISLKYAGLHIQQSSVTPQGVTELLKYFFRRNMQLTADPKTIFKYRKYRFPELSAQPTTKVLDDAEVELLLGYADRHHYSDNEVRSSCVSTLQEVDPLKHFFTLIDITYFVYSCANFEVTKETNGDCHIKKIVS